MTARLHALLGAGLCALLLSGTARGGTDARVQAALNKRIKVQIEEKSFEEAVRALCKAAGLTDVKVGPGEKPSAGSRSTRTSSIGGYRSGSSMRCRSAHGERYYSVTIARPLPLKDILKEVCDVEALTPNVIEGRLVIMDPAQVAAEMPFRAEEYRKVAGRVNVPVERDWRKAVEFILQTGAKGTIERHEGKIYSIGELKKIPSIQCLVKALGALKGHPEKDAVRVWLLSEAARRLQGHYHYRAKTREGRQAMGQIIAIMREVDSLEKEGACKKKLEALGKVIKKTAKSASNMTYAHGHIWGRAPELLLKHKMAYGYHGAAQARKQLGDDKAAAESMHKALYLHMPAYCYGGDWWFSAYSKLLPQAERAKAAREGLEYSLKRFAKFKAHFESLPDDWICRDCGEDKASHIADMAGRPARFHVRLAKALAADGDYAEAVKHDRSALKLDPEYGGQTRSAEWGAGPQRTVLDMAKTLSKAGQLEKAIDVMKEQIKKTPADHGLVIKLAGWYEQAGRKAEALAAYKQYIELKPPSVSYAKTRIAVLEGRIIEGPKSDLSDPENRKLHEQLSKETWKLFTERRIEEGLALVRSEALRHFPQDAVFLRREIDFLGRMKGKETERKEKLLAYRKLHPQLAPWADQQLQILTRKASGFNDYMRQVFDLRRHRDDNKALAMVREGYKKFPEHKASLAAQEVDILRRVKKYDEALKLARECAKKYPDQKLAFVKEEVECLIAAGKKVEAGKCLRELEAEVSKLGERQAWRFKSTVRYLKAKLEGKPFRPTRPRGPRRR